MGSNMLSGPERPPPFVFPSVVVILALLLAIAWITGSDSMKLLILCLYLREIMGIIREQHRNPFAS